MSPKILAVAGLGFVALAGAAFASDTAPPPKAPAAVSKTGCQVCVNDSSGKPHCYDILCKDMPPSGSILSQRLCVAGRPSGNLNWCVVPLKHPAAVR